MIQILNANKYAKKYLLLLGVFLTCFAALSQESAIKTIVIDAGHGGKDPGCHGAHSNEKTVCLAMALKLGELIKLNYPDIKVIYTRKTDVFIELDERAKIANRNNADLFICIHANAASAQAKGTETYVLGLHRTESQQKIAERENAAIYLEDDGGEKYKGFDLSPDAIIARQLQLSVFLDQSISFATKLQAEFTSIGRYDRGVKQAGFLVLYKTTMPSVLIETGFLTNPTEENFLSSDESQTKQAESMVVALRMYKAELEGIVYNEKEPFKRLSKTVQNPEKGPVKPANKDSKEEVNKEEENPFSSATPKDQVEFRVQIETSDKPIPLNSSKFKGLPVQEYQQDKLYKYTVGSFPNDLNGAKDFRLEMQKMGYQHAFVVAFLNGERISLEKGIKLAEK
ncbi:MAG: N-acetylmuramoyl-L-alanine amidase [Crocinitomicaceae bacterium]|jgi:N-acetylmuramoyl-L-alanine amidase|nr:N-acetylmuramoyl-L-alanine amidase [Crocinitomicaceae bacterium]